MGDVRADIFNQLAPEYDRHMLITGHTLALTKLLTATAPLLEAGPRILEIACGSGKSTHILYELLHPCEITALDISESMLAIATRSFEGNPRVRFSHADVDSVLPGWHGGPFDLIVAAYGVCWLDLSELLPSFRRMLTDNGRVLILDDVSLSVPLFAAKLPRALANRIVEVRTPRTKDDVEDLFSRKGFLLVHQQVVEVGDTHKSYAALFKKSQGTDHYPV
jgi:ubiquinone/menaquinone biosynthesis C-methylase UbiE